MAECYTNLTVKNVSQSKFGGWFEKETDSYPYYDSAEENDFYVDVEGGYGGYFWEALALKMISAFKGISFDGCNQLIWDDHLISTSFRCDGAELVLTRSLEITEECDDDLDEEYADELADMRAVWETENDIPYCVKLSVDDICTCAKIYEKAKKKLGDTAFVDSVCAKNNISKETLLLFAEIADFRKR